MGYSRYFTLDVNVGKGENNTLALMIIKDFRDSYDKAKYALDKEGCSSDSLSWNEYEYDITEFSKKYPYAVFDLYVECTELGDLCHLYVKAGEAFQSEATITFEPNPFVPTEIDTNAEVAQAIRETALSKLTDEEIELLGLRDLQKGISA